MSWPCKDSAIRRHRSVNPERRNISRLAPVRQPGASLFDCRLKETSRLRAFRMGTQCRRRETTVRKPGLSLSVAHIVRWLFRVRFFIGCFAAHTLGLLRAQLKRSRHVRGAQGGWSTICKIHICLPRRNIELLAPKSFDKKSLFVLSLVFFPLPLLSLAPFYTTLSLSLTILMITLGSNLFLIKMEKI